MDIRRASLRIRGKVQGVFYRESARREAERLGLRGFVKNLANGDVAAVAEGAAGSVDAFIAWCRRGPPLADVVDVAVADEPATGEFHHFAVER